GSAPAPAAAATAAGGARLEIAPAVASTTRNAGATSGTSAEGEGEMAANEQLQQAKEDIATRDAELQELRARVADLEKLKQQQQSLIAMKDSDLAAAQKRLAEAPAPAQGGGGVPFWLIGGLALIVAAVVAWFAARRRKPSPLPPLPRRQFDFVPPGAPVAVAPAAVDPVPPPSERDAVHEDEFEQADLREDERHVDPATAVPTSSLSGALRRDGVAPEPSPVPVAEDWRTLRATPASATSAVPGVLQPVISAEPADTPAAAVEPSAQPAPATGVAAVPSPPTPAAAIEPLQPIEPEPAVAPMASGELPFASPSRDRLELAVAYMDLGDKDTARSLLEDVATNGDPASRAEAVELLGRLA
ncbi:FimV/HubP family polar landmark protein, partial [Xanthomonas maliensis]|uniref:FimV/HubP family polar landmark protein n=1 Tax=Xanthomonas maliensis TaxID=1321368 RepID=UPI0003B6C5FA